MVELLTWTYSRQRADVMSGRGLHGLEAAADGDAGGAFSRGSSNAAAIEANGTLGTIIRSTAWQQSSVLHHDAERVHDLVVSRHDTDWVGARLLLQYGRQGTAPRWEVIQHLEPVLSGGRPEVRQAEPVVVRYANRETRVVPVQYCPVELYPSSEWAEMIRAEYVAWFRAVEWLAGQDLTRWAVAGIGAAREPWRR